MKEEVLDLEYKDLKLYQAPAGYCFTSDAVLLANYIRTKATDDVTEFCAGSGVISILLSKKQNQKHIYAFELQKRLAGMFSRSVKLNNLEDHITVYNARLEDWDKYHASGSMDVIFCNPPYHEKGVEMSENKEIAIATHELETCLDNIVLAASKLLKFKGNFYMVHRADRLVDVLSTLRKYKIEPKTLTIIYPKIDAEPVVFLVKATRGGKKGLRISKVTLAEDYKFSSNSF